MTEQRLVLHIEVEGFNAEGLDESAAIMAEPNKPTAEDYLYVVTEEWMREDVGLTLVSLPGDKEMNEDFVVGAFTGRIVGAALTPPQEPGTQRRAPRPAGEGAGSRGSSLRF